MSEAGSGATCVSSQDRENEQSGPQKAENARSQPDRALPRQRGHCAQRDPDLKQGDTARETMVLREELIGFM